MIKCIMLDFIYCKRVCVFLYAGAENADSTMFAYAVFVCVSGITVKCSFVILESVVFLARLLQGTIL